MQAFHREGSTDLNNEDLASGRIPRVYNRNLRILHPSNFLMCSSVIIRNVLISSPRNNKEIAILPMRIEELRREGSFYANSAARLGRRCRGPLCTWSCPATRSLPLPLTRTLVSRSLMPTADWEIPNFSAISTWVDFRFS
jgi:hypothetical protein